MPSPKANLQRVYDPPALPPRPDDGHKGLFGRVLIVGGSEDMLGAPVLSGAAALRMGSGLVQVAMPRSMLAVGLSVVPELVGLALDEDAASLKKMLEVAEKADVIAVGPGLGQSKHTGKIIDALIRLNKPLVVDADALNYLASKTRWPKDFAADAVFTPHPGEMKRLMKTEIPSDDAGRMEIAVNAAHRFNQIIVLKGHRTVVTDGRRIYVNRTGDSSLSKAGAGDVLTGILASLIGQKMAIFDAACAAVHIHGQSGEQAGRRLGRRSVNARDVIDQLSQVLQAKR